MKRKVSALIIISQILVASPSFSSDVASPSQQLGEENILEKAIDDALSLEMPLSDGKKSGTPEKNALNSKTPSAEKKPSLDEIKTPDVVVEKKEEPSKKKSSLDDLKIDESSVKLAEKPAPVVSKKEAAKKEQIVVVTSEVKSNKQPRKITPEEAKFLAELEEEKNKKAANAEQPKKPSRAYEPAPVEPQEVKHEGFVVERDSSKIIKKRMSYNDALNVKVCFSAGLSIVLDEDIQTELQRVIIDDKIFFDAIDFDNHRGVYVKLKQPIPDGKYWESAIRLVRKDNDKAYLINLIGVPCPKTGTSPFPKTVYIKDKFPGISGKNSKLMTPEDTIIELSAGLPRKNVNKIDVYDMIARSGSEWAVFGVQVQLPGKKELNPENFLIRMIDNLQIYQIPSKVDFLPIQSEKASRATNSPTARYKILVNIDKQYFVENRYLHMMLIDKSDGYYQYVRIDTLPYLLKLRERGFDI